MRYYYIIDNNGLLTSRISLEDNQCCFQWLPAGLCCKSSCGLVRVSTNNKQVEVKVDNECLIAWDDFQYESTNACDFCDVNVQLPYDEFNFKLRRYTDFDVWCEIAVKAECPTDSINYFACEREDLAMFADDISLEELRHHLDVIDGVGNPEELQTFQNRWQDRFHKRSLELDYSTLCCGDTYEKLQIAVRKKVRSAVDAVYNNVVSALHE